MEKEVANIKSHRPKSEEIPGYYPRALHCLCTTILDGWAAEEAGYCCGCWRQNGRGRWHDRTEETANPVVMLAIGTRKQNSVSFGFCFPGAKRCWKALVIYGQTFGVVNLTRSCSADQRLLENITPCVASALHIQLPSVQRPVWRDALTREQRGRQEEQEDILSFVWTYYKKSVK